MERDRPPIAQLLRPQLRAGLQDGSEEGDHASIFTRYLEECDELGRPDDVDGWVACDSRQSTPHPTKPTPPPALR